jgi:hypothetical protein
LYMNGDGVRDREASTGTFIEADTQGNGSNEDPISLHRYLYAGDNPITMWDPSGHELGELLTTVGIIASLNAAFGLFVANNSALQSALYGNVGIYAPDAAIIGVQGTSSSVVRDLNRVFGRLFPSVAQIALNSGHIAGNIGVEAMIDIASAQLSLWLYYGPTLQTSVGDSAQVYSGLVWNLWNTQEYSGIFFGGGGQLGTTSLSFFHSKDSVGPVGGTIGLATSGGGFNLTGDYFQLFSGTSVEDLSSMAYTVPLAALWAGLSATLIPGGDSIPAVLTAASLSSFWPYSKWLTPAKLFARQHQTRPPGANWV